MTGEPELMIESPRKRSANDLLYVVTPLIFAIGEALIGSLLLAALFAISAAWWAVAFVRAPRRRRAFIEGDRLMIVNSTWTWRLALASISDVTIRKAFLSKSAVFVHGKNARHALEATFGMSSAELEAAAESIRVAVEAGASA